LQSQSSKPAGAAKSVFDWHARSPSDRIADIRQCPLFLDRQIRVLDDFTQALVIRLDLGSKLLGRAPSRFLKAYV